MKESRPIAHVRFDEHDQPIEHWLDEHLRDVAKLASGYAAPFGSIDWGHVAGIWHDLGKYNPKFQKYIGEKTGYRREERENAHIEINTFATKPPFYVHEPAPG
jgi:CRISPR-associated endonuclease/helicase Cas3